MLPVISAILNEGVSEATPMTGPVCPLALVIAPTRELAVQILNESLKFSFESKVKSVVLYGGVSVNHQTEFLRRGCHICIATPGRLEDFVKRGKVTLQLRLVNGILNETILSKCISNYRLRPTHF